MEKKFVKYGNHIIGNDNDGYMYNYNTSEGHDFNSHMHKCYEFIHVIRGNMLYTVEDTEYTLSDGDFIMTNPDELHSFRFPDKCEYHREFLHIYPGFLENFPDLTKALNSRGPGYFNVIPAAKVKQYGIDKIFNDIYSCCTAIIPETDLIVLADTIRLIAAINQILRTESPEQHAPALNKKTNAVRNYIDHHYNEDVTLEIIARALYTSPSYLSRTFKKEMGMTIKSYLNLRRITRAKNLIMEGLQATDVFQECGFADYSTFYRSFVKYAGMTPIEFKHTQIKKERHV